MRHLTIVFVCAQLTERFIYYVPLQYYMAYIETIKRNKKEYYYLTKKPVLVNKGRVNLPAVPPKFPFRGSLIFSQLRGANLSSTLQQF